MRRSYVLGLMMSWLLSGCPTPQPPVDASADGSDVAQESDAGTDNEASGSGAAYLYLGSAAGIVSTVATRLAHPAVIYDGASGGLPAAPNQSFLGLNGNQANFGWAVANGG